MVGDRIRTGRRVERRPGRFDARRYVSIARRPRAGTPRLLPVWTWDVQGGPDPNSWWYRCELAGPPGTVTRTAPAASVLHFRYSFQSSRPWQGVSPVRWAAASGRLAGGLDRQFGDEASTPSGYMCSVPDLALPGVDDTDPKEGADEADELGKMRRDLERAGGRSVLVPAGAWDVVNGRVRGGDYESRRFGLRPGQAEVLLRADAQKWTTLVFGIPPGLFDQNAASGGTRDGWRVFVNLRLASLGRLVEQELRRKLDAPDLELSFMRAPAGRYGHIGAGGRKPGQTGRYAAGRRARRRRFVVAKIAARRYQRHDAPGGRSVLHPGWSPHA